MEQFSPVCSSGHCLLLTGNLLLPEHRVAPLIFSLLDVSAIKGIYCNQRKFLKSLHLVLIQGVNDVFRHYCFPHGYLKRILPDSGK